MVHIWKPVVFLASLCFTIGWNEGANGANSDRLESIAKSAHFLETFEGEHAVKSGRWVLSTDPKYTGQDVKIKKYVLKPDIAPVDQGLILNEPARHYGVSTRVDPPFSIEQELVVQYEVKLQRGLNCGGAYLKLLRATEDGEEIDLAHFNNQSPYVIMFGPDKCAAKNRIHFIFQHKNPVTGTYEEKHLIDPPSAEIDTDTHLYTLWIQRDNSFEIFVDQKSVEKGTLFKKFDPPVLPPKKIEDPDDVKPADWVEEDMIRDPNAVKPADWDEDAPRYIPDMEAVKPADWLDDEPATIDDPNAPKPEDWDDEDDGEYEAPQIPNPKCAEVSGCGEWKRPTKENPEYKGKWYPPLVLNPAYKGEWEPRKIPNPAYFENSNPASELDPIGAIAIEVWTMKGGITYDNIWLGHDIDDARAFAEETWRLKRLQEKKEADKKEDDKLRQMRDVKAVQGGFLNRLEVMWIDIIRYVKNNPTQGIGYIVAIILTLIGSVMFLCSRGEAPERQQQPQAPPSINTEKDSDLSRSENSSSEQEEGTSSGENDSDSKSEGEQSGVRRRRKKKSPKAE